MKPSTAFYVRSRGGLSDTCKECAKLKQKHYYAANRERRLEWQKKYSETHREEIAAYNSRPEVIKRTKQRKQSSEGRKLISEYVRRSNAKHPEHVKARRDLNNAIMRGKVQRQTVCSQCGSADKIEAHHRDYSKPFDVQWLCNSCHHREHQKGH